MPLRSAASMAFLLTLIGLQVIIMLRDSAGSELMLATISNVMAVDEGHSDTT
jgi:hypothetical protein